MPLQQEALIEYINRALSLSKKTKFEQAVELIVTLKDFDVKSPEGRLREVVFLPHKPAKEPNVCVVAAGDLLLEAKKLGVTTISRDDLNAMRGDKKRVKAIGRSCDWVLVQADLMGLVGSVLGPALGPRGKVPTPIPPRANLTEFVNNYKRAAWVRIRGQPQIMSRVGTTSMKPEELVDNVNAVLSVVESRIGAAKIGGIYIKTTMGTPVEVPLR
ncbi:50S ribosomal protein L1P [Acidilobus saccharovorans 345-15]|uniref:Large ribosomal subunit protein uL1 n=1 Tax=Acidilobus saccharovorans (strain DSM 16705 / JCM 18335 / VKM B-2471 / 345-15) TaxID=666510 RepID=D9Q018_ACIS3|nr:50S ribosomal protein L1 [Acidilobus saccharovorans]ADL18656.1 50S ribosomal protein L1P [Acidilobus saccharovorans 345-15]